MNTTEIYYERLKYAVELRMGHKLCIHSDFTKLSNLIFEQEKELISPTTLKRMWGYIKQERPTPQTRTLNTLAKFVGHSDWKFFCNYQEEQDSYSSELVRQDALHSFTLKSQEKVEVCWYPERRIVLKHEDGNLFTVVESINSKLLPGMTVHCERFVKSEPLWLKDVKGDGITEACDYLCGKINGIEYRVL